jgi:hypothetical protein
MDDGLFSDHPDIFTPIYPIARPDCTAKFGHSELETWADSIAVIGEQGQLPPRLRMAAGICNEIQKYELQATKSSDLI